MQFGLRERLSALPCHSARTVGKLGYLLVQLLGTGVRKMLPMINDLVEALEQMEDAEDVFGPLRSIQVD